MCIDKTCSLCDRVHWNLQNFIISGTYFCENSFLSLSVYCQVLVFFIGGWHWQLWRNCLFISTPIKKWNFLKYFHYHGVWHYLNVLSFFNGHIGWSSIFVLINVKPVKPVLKVDKRERWSLVLILSCPLSRGLYIILMFWWFFKLINVCQSGLFSYIDLHWLVALNSGVIVRCLFICACPCNEIIQMIDCYVYYINKYLNKKLHLCTPYLEINVVCCINWCETWIHRFTLSEVL